MTSHQTKPIVLTLAGSDPCGGAGLQADLRVTAALGCYGVSVVTALTAQNTMGVAHVWPLAPEQIEEQARTLLSDIQPQAVKVGMLGSGPAAQAVAAILKQYHMPNIVADTILHSTSGADLLGCSKTDPLIEVMSMARMITPNLPEAAALLSAPPERPGPRCVGVSERRSRQRSTADRRFLQCRGRPFYLSRASPH